MSTRCNIIIKDNRNKTEHILYHHCDGYPDGVGYMLSKELIPLYMQKYDEYNAAELTLYINKVDNYFEIDNNIHGDIDYLYILTTDKNNIHYQCISVPCFDDYDYEKLINCKIVEEFDISKTDAPEKTEIENKIILFVNENYRDWYGKQDFTKILTNFYNFIVNENKEQ